MSSFIKSSLVSMLILCVMFQHAMAGCGLVCGLRYSGGRWSYGCSLQCGWGKRSIRGPVEDSGEIPLPSTFGKYDLNKDGGITLEEMATALNVVKHAEGTEIGFRKADRNSDGQIDCKEFMEAPFLFAHRPKCSL